MSQAQIEEKIVKREVGERVKIKMVFDKPAIKAAGDEEAGILEAVITSSATDRHNENIVTQGIDTSNYLKNPVVLYGHDYFGLPIGKTLQLTEMKNKIKARFQLAIEEYDFAKTVYDMVLNGYLNAVSIGGIVKKWSDDYRTIEEMEMIEFSLVSIPANADAMITARSFEEAAGKPIETVAKEFEAFSHGTMLDKLKGLDDDGISESIRVLKSLVATLEESNKARSSAGDGTQKSRILKIRLKESAVQMHKESERIIRVIKLKP